MERKIAEQFAVMHHAAKHPSAQYSSTICTKSEAYPGSSQ